jgi:hypothetical protein
MKGSQKKGKENKSSTKKVIGKAAKQALANKKTGVKKSKASLEEKVDECVKRQEMIIQVLGLEKELKEGEKGVVGDLNKSILKMEEYLLHTGKRIDNILAALKNHREFLIKINKKIYKADAKKRIQMELSIINNTLSIMAISGFDIDKSIYSDVKRIKKMMLKEDVEMINIKKRMERLERKFEDEMERFDYESIFKKKGDIPGYR